MSTAGGWYLAIDLGSGGLKVASVAHDGAVLCSAFRSIDTHATDDGGAEQDANEWWEHLRSAVGELGEAGGLEEPCRGIGITGQ